MNQATWLFANPSQKVNPDVDNSHYNFILFFIGNCVYFLFFVIVCFHKLWDRESLMSFPDKR